MVRAEVWWSSLAAADWGLLDLLDATERARVRSLERPADQGRSLVAAALLRVAVGHRLSAPAGDVVIDRTCAECGRPHGRPRVLGPGEGLPHVSVSHSGVVVVVALSAHVPVGVDVQRAADLMGLADPVGLAGLDPRAERAAAQWARRESVLKAGGDAAGAVVREIVAPREGYAAALALVADRAPTDDELDVRHWPAPHRGEPAQSRR